MSFPRHPEVAPLTHSTLRIDIPYALVAAGGTTLWSVLNGWLFYFYLPPAGEGKPLVPAALFSLGLVLTRIVDGVVDPLIGYLSDHTRSSWGRRLPFVVASAFPMLVFFVLLWSPPGSAGSIANLVYVLIVLQLYLVAYSFVNIPYEALLPEIAPTESRRVRIATWSASLQVGGMILGSVAGYVIERLGYPGMALAYAVVALPLYYLPALVLRKRTSMLPAPAPRQPFLRGMLTTLRNKAFRVYTLAWALYWATMTLMPALIPYIATELCLMPKSDAVLLFAASVGASIASYPVAAWLSRRFGKRAVFSGSLLSSFLVLSCLPILGKTLPIPLAWQGVGWCILGSVAVSGAVVTSQPLAAEVTDRDAALTNRRREGIYYASWGLVDNIVTGLASAALPLMLLLGRSSSGPQGPLGVRLAGVLCGGMMLIAFLVFLRYPRMEDSGADAGPPERAT
jgi:GPH family glycoside/pentoside/hexuronide:cation symporter